MRGQPAKILAGIDVRRLIAAGKRRRYPDRNETIILLSVKAGLRACEIARLTWPMVTDARGRVGSVIELPGNAAKMGSGRRIPIHPALGHALATLRPKGRPDGPVIRSQRGGPMTADAIVNWFAALYVELGLYGCSSHSGRRTFVTRAARLITNNRRPQLAQDNPLKEYRRDRSMRSKAADHE